MKNLGLKLWSVVIALALAYFVNSLSNSSVISLVVPVDFRNLPESRVVLLPTVRTAQVTIRGPLHLMEGVTQSPPSFAVPIPEEVGNRYTIQLQRNLLALPPGVEVLNIEPPEMELILDDMITRNFKIEVPRIGVLKKEFKLDEMKIVPDTVKITGPKSELENLEAIETNAIDLRGITGTVKRDLRLQVPGRYVQPGIDRVSVELIVRQLQIERKFKEIPVAVRDEKDRGYNVAPKSVTVEISGPRAQMKRFDITKLKPYVVVSEGENRGSFDAKVQIELPALYKVIFINPETVTVKKN